MERVFGEVSAGVVAVEGLVFGALAFERALPPFLVSGVVGVDVAPGAGAVGVEAVGGGVAVGEVVVGAPGVDGEGTAVGGESKVVRTSILPLPEAAMKPIAPPATSRTSTHAAAASARRQFGVGTIRVVAAWPHSRHQS
ncbi:MAG TPA: hypothetical protein VHE14_02215 [Solirubrobacteraceae bacterium]|nr:hypothetical protein [Solirubrobacteraceae bacterium]